MKKIAAYDLPLRLFHWVFALLFLLSFSIAQLIDDDSSLYAYHMLSGMLMVSMVLLRIVWGFVGPKTARFGSFRLQPAELVAYFKSVLSSKSKRYLGHNPASSYAAILMMAFAIGLGFTGMLMSFKINKHFFEEVHELLANSFLIVVIFHIAGVVLHQIKHRDGMITSMLDGKKDEVVGESEIKSNHPVVAFVFVALFVGMGAFLLHNFDERTGELTAFGTKIQLGEDEHRNHDDDD